MSISSRTPEGLPGRCGFCGTETSLEFCDPGNDATCFSCGCQILLTSAILDFLSRQPGLPAAAEKGIVGLTAAIESLDSISFVELVMELEEKFEFDWSAEEVNAVQSTAGLIRLILKNQIGG